MKEIAEKYPKGIELFAEYLHPTVEVEYSVNRDIKYGTIIEYFGYLVLEFFPKYGIEITRDINFNDDGSCIIDYAVWYMGEFEDAKTPQEVMLKAFQILESQEE